MDNYDKREDEYKFFVRKTQAEFETAKEHFKQETGNIENQIIGVGDSSTTMLEDMLIEYQKRIIDKERMIYN